jgi:hypothetical protein
MSDDQTTSTEPQAPVAASAPEPGAQPGAQPGSQPAYAMPLPAGYPTYAAAQRPRFADQVMGMRAVVATSLACLVVGGLGGFALGHATGDDHNGFGRAPGGFQQRGDAFPNGPGTPQQPFGQSQGQGQGQGGR